MFDGIRQGLGMRLAEEYTSIQFSSIPMTKGLDFLKLGLRFLGTVGLRVDKSLCSVKGREREREGEGEGGRGRGRGMEREGEGEGGREREGEGGRGREREGEGGRGREREGEGGRGREREKFSIFVLLVHALNLHQ